MKLEKILLASTRIVKSSTAARGRKAITLTPAAITRVKELMSQQPNALAIKIGMQQRGCNGFSYTLDYSNSKGRFDEEIEQEGVKIWIDPKAQLSIIGSEMDFIQSKLASEFVFHNPNIKSTCGCGESFNI